MNVYKSRVNSLEKELKRIEKKLKTISNIRLLFSLLAIGSLIHNIQTKNMLSFIIFCLASIAFVTTLLYHDKTKGVHEYLISKLMVLQKRIDRSNGKWNLFSENGEEYIREDSNVEKDIDIFGINSLYQYLCVAKTKEGKLKLKNYLSSNKESMQTLYERQKAIQELIEKEDFAIEFETCISMLDTKEGKVSWFNNFIQYLNNKKVMVSKQLCLVSIIFPIVSLIILVASIVHLDYKIFVLIGMIAVQFLLSNIIIIRNKTTMANVFQFCRNIEEYHQLLLCIQNERFKSKHLSDLTSKLSKEAEITRGIQSLNMINGIFFIRDNPYIYLIFQMLFMYDVHIIRLLENWKQNYASCMKDLFDIIGEFEALLSLSVVGQEHAVSYPVFSKSKELLLEAENIGHPLIAKSQVVTNSIRTNSGAVMITGSNMSGKTTFLRTLALNIILAYAGAPVFATYFNISHMRMFTSMRVFDDTSKGISSFYAEVLRIKEMVDYAKTGEPMIVFIDEIFKGTNSMDRLIGAKEVITTLHRNNVIEFISTHDFELVHLIEDNIIQGSNYHFQEYYKGDQINFDYKIRPGKCKTTNAQHILRMAGIIIQ